MSVHACVCVCVCMYAMCTSVHLDSSSRVCPVGFSIDIAGVSGLRGAENAPLWSHHIPNQCTCVCVCVCRECVAAYLSLAAAPSPRTRARGTAARPGKTTCARCGTHFRATRLDQSEVTHKAVCVCVCSCWMYSLSQSINIHTHIHSYIHTCIHTYKCPLLTWAGA